MPIISQDIFGLLACGSVVGASGVAPIPTNGGSRLYGCTTAGISRSGAGTYLITLSDPITPADGMIAITTQSLINASVKVSSWAAGVITVVFFNATLANTPTDCDFTFAVYRLTHQP